MIEFGNLQADLPRYQNPGSLKIDNVIPLHLEKVTNKLIETGCQINITEPMVAAVKEYGD